MANGFNSTQMTQLAQLINGAIDQRLGTANQASIPAASVAPTPPSEGVVDLGVNPTPKISQPVDLVLPTTPIHGVDGNRFIELAKLGKGAYTPLSNTLFALIRAQILEDNGGLSYENMTSSDRKELNKYITKVMSDRVNDIRKILKATAEAPQSQPITVQAAQPPATSAPTVAVEQPRIDFSKLNAGSSGEGSTLNNPLPSSPTIQQETNPNSIGKVGDREVAKLVAECREGIAIGTPVGTTLRTWFQKESNQKRQKIAYKIVEAAAAELGVKLKARTQGEG